MSLNRLMLRLAALNALSPQPDDDYAPTLAGDGVFDSRLDDIEFDQEGERELPIIMVYTDSDEQVSYSTADGGMDGYRHVLLRVIFAVGSFNTSIVDGKKKVVYGLPTTDAELEALLDIFEWQILRTLQHPLRPASLALQKMILNWSSWHSEPSRSADKNNRLAERTLTFRVRIEQDCTPAWRMDTDPAPPAVDAIPTFPDAPYLDPLIASLAKSPEHAGLIADLREIITGNPRIVIPRFRSMGVNIDAIQPADPSLLASLNRTSGPDGRVEVQQEWTIA